MADELRGIENGFNLLYGRTPNPDPRYDPIRQDQGYQMQLDPMLEPSLNLNGSTNPPARQMADQAQPLDEERLRALAGWSQSPDQGGLGVAGPGPAPDRQESLDEHFARQIFPGFKGELSFGDKLRLRDGMMNAIPQIASRRETIAAQAAKLEEEKKQHKQKMFLDVMTKPGLTLSQREDLLKPMADGDEQITAAVEGIGKKRLGKVGAYLKLYPQEMRQLKQDWEDGKVTAEDIDARVSMLDERTSRRAAADVEASEYTRLTAIAEESLRTGQPMNSGDQKEFIRLQTEMSKRQEELTQLRLKNELSQKKIDDPGSDDKPDRTEINRVSLSETGKNFEALAPGSPEQRMVIQKHAERYAQGRTNVQMGTVPALKEQADFYTVKGLENLELEQAPKGMTEGQYRKGPFRQLDDKEKDAVVQYKVAQKTVETMNRVADQLITAKTPAQALKQKIALEAGAYTGRNGLASAYQKDRDAFSSRMARLVEVGVLTNTDVTRWSDTFGSFGDTVQTLKAKQALFGEIQDETQRMLKLKLGGKPITSASRSKLDALLDKANQYRSVEDDANILFGGAKK